MVLPLARTGPVMPCQASFRLFKLQGFRMNKFNKLILGSLCDWLKRNLILLAGQSPNNTGTPAWDTHAAQLFWGGIFWQQSREKAISYSFVVHVQTQQNKETVADMNMSNATAEAVPQWGKDLQNNTDVFFVVTVSMIIFRKLAAIY